MSYLFLIRHALTKKTEKPPETWPLSLTGQKDSVELAEKKFWRDVEIIFSSPESKAYSTAQPASRQWNIPIQINSCLREVHRPYLVEDYKTTVARFFSSPEKSIREWEPASQATTRIKECIRNILSIHSKKNLAVVSHGLILTLFLADLENRNPIVEEWSIIPFPGVAIIDSDKGTLIQPWENPANIPD